MTCPIGVPGIDGQGARGDRGGGRGAAAGGDRPGGDRSEGKPPGGGAGALTRPVYVARRAPGRLARWATWSFWRERRPGRPARRLRRRRSSGPVKGVALVDAAALEAALEPADALRAGAVGEALRHARCRATCAAACRRRSARPRSAPPRCRPARASPCSAASAWPRRRPGSRPAARRAPRARWPAPRRTAAALRVDLVGDAQQVLHVVADLVGDHVGLREIAGRAEARAQRVEEAEVDVDLARRPGSRTAPSPPGPGRRPSA